MKSQLIQEIQILTSRSSGPGGQHVNKTESRVELHWNLESSQILSEKEKSLVRAYIGKRLTEDGTLIMVSQKSRSQLKNREDVTQRFLMLIERSLIPPKKRIPTKPSRASVERRLKTKRERSEVKKRRGKWKEGE